MASSSIPAEIGAFFVVITRRCSSLTPDSHPSSGIPFETEIGIGKVIKGWDEGTL